MIIDEIIDKKNSSHMKFLSISFLMIILTAMTKPFSDKHDIYMKNFNEDSTEIVNILNDSYFKGIYTGDINLLGTIYYPGTLLFGDAAGKPYFKTLAQYLDGV